MATAQELLDQIGNTQQPTGAKPGGVIGGGSLAKGDLSSSEGLYGLAVQNGFQNQANSILARQQGEDTKQIFSGGFISDIFDTMNALQYGVTGVLKGKTFGEGVKTRQSFSDKDALGDNGLPGVAAGIALDILVDPLTYIAPLSLVRKVPLLSKLAKASKESIFGKTVTKSVPDASGLPLSRTFQTQEGGTKVGQYLQQKLAWKVGKDPIYMKTFEKSLKNTAISTKKVIDFGKPISKLTPELSKLILKVGKDGRFVRESLPKLAKNLKPDDFKAVSHIYKMIDDLGAEAVDLGLISKKKYEENIGEYIKAAYKEFEAVGGKKQPFGYATTGIKKQNKRVEVLSEERLADRIDNPAYLLMKTAIDLTRDVENAKLFKKVNELFGTDVAQEGFTQIPKTTRFTSSQGAQAEMKANIADINAQMKPLLKELKITFKGDKKLLAEITGVERLLAELGIKREDELFKFFAEGQVVKKTSQVASRVKGWAKLPEKLQPLGKSLAKFKTLEEALKSPLGIKLERAYENGVLERAGFPDSIFKKGDKEITVTGMKQMFNFVKKPFTPAKTLVRERAVEGDMKKIIALQKRIEALTAKSSKLKTIDKTSINNSFINLENNISELKFAKEGLQEQLIDVRAGDLAGKYIPDHMADYLNEIMKPAATGLGQVEKKLVGDFKFFKVVMNPGTHARNIVSNKILNYWKLGMNPLDPRTIKAEGKALREIMKGSGKYIDEATPHGYNLDTFASAEMKDLLESPEMAAGMKQFGSKWQVVKKKLGDLYQAEENQAKLTAYIYQRDVMKLKPEAAWLAAESATFNYAQVTPFIRKMRESIFGMPFITFTYKATPVAIETALKNPQRIGAIGKIKQGIENLSDNEETARERATEPPWVKDGFYIKLPMKDSEGRSSYFDLTYILPFGDLVAGNFWERGMNLETGTPEAPATAILKKSPFLQLVAELGKNKDFYGNNIWKNSDPAEKQTKDLFRHLIKTYSPPPLAEQLPGGYKADGTQTQRGIIGAMSPQERQDQQRTVSQEVLRNFGIKVQPIDADIQETYAEWNKKKGLETLLKEQGVLKELNIKYVPDDESKL